MVIGHGRRSLWWLLLLERMLLDRHSGCLRSSALHGELVLVVVHVLKLVVVVLVAQRQVVATRWQGKLLWMVLLAGTRHGHWRALLVLRWRSALHIHCSFRR